MITKLKTINSLSLAVALVILFGGAAYALTQVTRDVSATVDVQVSAPNGIEIYLDAARTLPANSIAFGTVAVDPFGTPANPGPTPVPVWVENQSNSVIELTLTDDFSMGNAVLTGSNQSPILQPGEVLPVELILNFHRGEAGIHPFTVMFQAEGPVPPAGVAETIKIGVLHSLSGTMSISETAMKDATLMAAEEINANGGVLGKQLEVIVEDGASDWPTFAEKARKLLQNDQVAVVFGGWTSASRKAMLPVFESNNGLLFYPVQYEGLESSPNIFYTGATTNQQIVPAVEYLLSQGKTRFYLLGSDYVFPRTSNLIINQQLAASGLEPVAEEYTPLEHTQYSTVISKIREANPDVVFNTLNGDSNVAFFKQLKDAGISFEDLPTLSVSVAEEEITGIGADNMLGHLVAWNYFQTTDTPENVKFVQNFKARYGENRVTDDPIEAGYFGVYLWAKAVEKAGSTDVAQVKEASKGLQFQAPGGLVTIHPENQHVSKTSRIGEVRSDGQIVEVWNSGEPVVPDPYLDTYEWAEGLRERAQN